MKGSLLHVRGFLSLNTLTELPISNLIKKLSGNTVDLLFKKNKLKLTFITRLLLLVHLIRSHVIRHKVAHTYLSLVLQAGNDLVAAICSYNFLKKSGCGEVSWVSKIDKNQQSGEMRALTNLSIPVLTWSHKSPNSLINCPL